MKFRQNLMHKRDCIASCFLDGNFLCGNSLSFSLFTRFSFGPFAGVSLRLLLGREISLFSFRLFTRFWFGPFAGISLRLLLGREISGVTLGFLTLQNFFHVGDNRRFQFHQLGQLPRCLALSVLGARKRHQTAFCGSYSVCNAISF